MVVRPRLDAARLRSRPRAAAQPPGAAARHAAGASPIASFTQLLYRRRIPTGTCRSAPRVAARADARRRRRRFIARVYTPSHADAHRGRRRVARSARRAGRPTRSAAGRRRRHRRPCRRSRSLGAAAVAGRPRLSLVHRPARRSRSCASATSAWRASTPDYHALLVLNMILGGQFVSRINMKLREEKGFTYGARTAFDFRRGPGSVRAADQRAVGRDGRRARARRSASSRPSAATGRSRARSCELGRAALTRGYPRNFETAEQVARAAAQLALYDLPDDYFSTFVPTSAGADRGRRHARRRTQHLDPARLLTVVVGDRDKVGPSLGGARPRRTCPKSRSPELPEHEPERSLPSKTQSRPVRSVGPGVDCHRDHFSEPPARVSLSLVGVVGVSGRRAGGAPDLAAASPSRSPSLTPSRRARCRRRARARRRALRRPPGDCSSTCSASAQVISVESSVATASNPSHGRSRAGVGLDAAGTVGSKTPSASGSELRARVYRAPVQKPAERQPVDPLERRHAGAVVAARQHVRARARCRGGGTRRRACARAHRERQIVARVDEQDALVRARVRDTATGEIGIQIRRSSIEIDVSVEALAHVRRREPLPDDVGEVRRDVIERRRLSERLVRGGQHREARAQAGAEDADRLVALLRQPRRSRAARRAPPAGTPASSGRCWR